MKNILLLFLLHFCVIANAQDTSYYYVKILFKGKPLAMVDSLVIQTNGQTQLQRKPLYKAINDTFRVALTNGTHYLHFWVNGSAFVDHTTVCNDCPRKRFSHFTPGFGNDYDIHTILLENPEHSGINAYSKRYDQVDIEKLNNIVSNYRVRLLVSPKGVIKESEVIGLANNEQHLADLILKGIPLEGWKPARSVGLPMHYEYYIERSSLLPR